MARYRDLDKINPLYATSVVGAVRMFFLENLPEEDVTPVVHAHWMRERLDKEKKKYVPVFYPMEWDKEVLTCGGVYCSNCEEWLTGSDEYPCFANYCPRCGAKMDEQREE